MSSMLFKALNPHSITNDDNKLPLYANQKRNIKSALDNAFDVDVWLNEQQFDQLAEVVRRPINILNPSGGLKDHPHPIPFILNRMAYDLMIQQYGGINGVIDIGGSPLRTPPNHHICSLVNDIRTNSRYANIAMKQTVDDPNNYNYLLEEEVIVGSFSSWSDKSIAQQVCGIKKAFKDFRFKYGISDSLNRFRPKFKRGLVAPPCIHGAQSCNHKAFHAYMINVYDIPLEDFTIIFAKHDLKTLDCFMFLPDVLIDPKYVLDQKFYNCRFVKRQNKTNLQFDLCDDANLYEHDYYEWRKYLTTTIIEGTTFSIAIEIINSWGTFKHLKFTKINCNKGIITRSVSMERYSAYYKVPNICFWFTHKTHDIMNNCFVLPRHFVDAVITHAVSLQDVSYTYKNVYSYARSTKTSIRFINEGVTNFVYAGLECTESDYEQIVLSLFIISAIRRRKATQTIADVFNDLKKIDGFWSTVKNCFYYVVRKTRNQDKLKIKLEIEDDEFFKLTDANIYPVDNVYYEDVVKSYNDEFNSDLIYTPVKRSALASTAKIDKTSSSVSTMPTKTPVMVSPPNPTGVPSQSTASNGSATENKTPVTVSPPSSTAVPLPNTNNVSTGFAGSLTKSPIYSGVIVRYDRMNNEYRYHVSKGMACVRKIHSNSGGGRCGFLSVRHFVREKMIINPKLRKMVVDAVWFTAQDIFDLCEDNNLSCIMHYFDNNGLAGIEESYVDGHKGVAKIMWRNNHFEAIDCVCPGAGCVIGDYKNIYKNVLLKQMRHVNSCNVNLSDGSGQARAFRSAHGNYDSKIIKPIAPYKNYDLNYNGYKLSLFVPYDNSVKMDLNKSIKTFKDYSAHIDASKDEYLTPLLGTAIFQTPLCCFVDNVISHNLVINFHDIVAVQGFYDTKRCSHGGALVGRGNLTKIPIVPSPYYDYVNPIDDDKQTEKMYNKYDEIFQNLTTNFPDILQRRCHFIDLTADRGAFAKAHGKLSDLPYYCYSMTNDRYTKPIKPYSKIITDNSVIVWDYYPCDDLDEIIGNVKHNNVWLIYKIDPFKDLSSTYAQMDNVIVRCDASRSGSGELYCITKLGNTSDKAVDIQNFVNNMDFERLNKGKCDCRLFEDYIFQENPFFNNVIKVNVSDSDYAQYLADWESDPYVPIKLDVQKYLKNIGMVFPCCNGVAGCSKTTSFINKMGVCKKCALIISPYNTHKYAKTFGLALKFLLSDNAKHIRYIFVDEIFTFDARYLVLLQNILYVHLPDAKIYTGGDYKQTTSPDYDGSYIPITLDDENVSYHLGTHRSPQDVVKYCAAYVGGGYQSTSKINESIKILDSDVDPMPEDYLNYICLHREDCDHYTKSLKGKHVYTVKTAQGNTFEKAVLILPTDISLAYNQAYLYTALTRHTTELVIYGTKQQTERVFSILGTAIERALEAVDIIPITTTVVEKEEIITYPHVEPVLQNYHLTKEDVEGVLAKIFIPTNDPYAPHIDARFNILADLKDGQPLKFSTKLEAAVNNFVTIRGRRIGNRFFNKIYHPKDHATAIRGMLKRYAENNVKLDKGFVGKLIKAYLSLVDEDKLKKVKDVGISIDDMWYYTTEYLRNLQLKFPNKDAEIYDILSHDDVELLKDVILENGKIVATDVLKGKLEKTGVTVDQIDAFIKRLNSMLTDPDAFLKYKDIEAEWDDTHHTFVQFHMKRQPKEVRTNGYDGIFKAGQGVSAWSKMYNVMISGMVRYFSDIMNSIDKDFVQNSYNMSDKDLSNKFKKCVGHTIRNRNIKKFANDFSEFDSAQDEISILAFAAFLSMLGFNEKCIKLYVNLRLKWVMALRGSSLQHDTITTLKGVFKKHSGEPATLCGNTWFNRAVTCLCVTFLNPYICAFKGDDSLIVADSVAVVRSGVDYLWKLLGYKFKVSFLNYPEYIANIITPEGFFPDLVRRASRVISKIYNDKVDWAELRRSTADSLAVINNGYSEVGFDFVVAHYAEVGITITKDDCKVLHKFLVDVSSNDDYYPSHVDSFHQPVY